jgi:peptidoglycan/LPS O-acetylase OafA/YrhL
MPPDAGAADTVIGQVLGMEGLGVDLFFVLSGYLITSILDRTRTTDARMKTFYVRRILRIFPVYYGFLLVAELFLSGMGPDVLGTTSTLWQWLYLSNVGKAINGAMANGLIYGHFWSLSVEEHYYLAWPFIVFHTSRRTLARVCVAIFFASIFANIAVSAAGHYEQANILTPTHMYSLASGSLVAMIQLENPTALTLWTRRIVLMSIAALFLAIPVSIAFGMKIFWFSAQLVSLFAFPAVIGMLVLGMGGRVRNGLSATWLAKVGRYSYAMYVFHLPIIFILLFKGLRISSVRGNYFPYQIILSVGVALLSFGAAFVSWHVLEKQFLKLAPRYHTPRSDVGNDGLVTA